MIDFANRAGQIPVVALLHSVREMSAAGFFDTMFVVVPSQCCRARRADDCQSPHLEKVSSG